MQHPFCPCIHTHRSHVCLKLLLQGSLAASNSGEILSCSCINLQLVAFVYEKRYHNLCTSLNNSRLGSTLCCITCKPWLCLCNKQLYKQRRLNSKYITIVRTDRSLIHSHWEVIRCTLVLNLHRYNPLPVQSVQILLPVS